MRTKDVNFRRFLTETIICYYSSYILFVRSFFLKERPKFIVVINLMYPLYTFLIPTNVAFDAFIQMRILLIIGLYLISIDSLAGYISKIIVSQDHPYLNHFFNNRDHNAYLSAGWSAIIIGKTPMTATGRAAIAAGFVSGGVFLYNGYLQRTHETSQAASQRAHESSEAARQRAYSNYTYARDEYNKSYFKRGSKPTWSEENYTSWTDTK